MGIRTTLSEETQAQELYSSDEETQQLSDAKRKVHAAFRNSMGEALQNKAKDLWAIASDPDPVGAVIEHYVTFLCSIPQLPELLAAYVEEFLEEATEERRAEMLGELLAEALVQVVPLPKVKATQLVGIKKKLGKAGKQVAAKVPIKQAKFWKLTKAKAIKIKSHRRYGTIYKSKSDGLWWASVKGLGHGDTFKVFKETTKGLEWFKDADEFGNFIVNKHKGPRGLILPRNTLKSVNN